MGFSKDFLWGAATASYQIEGAADKDGRGMSVWDTFSHAPGKVKNGDTGDNACDHYHRFKEDVALMAGLGLKAHRFSIAWPRVLPDGAGAVNKKGLDFYDRLVDELLAKNIRPCATLFHWDFPQALYDKGGWNHPDAPQWFAEYTAHAVRRLGDRIPCWMTFNEMMVSLDYGHRMGFHAPGEHLAVGPVLAILKNMLLAHGLSTQVLRAALPPAAQIGIAHAGPYYTPATESPEDIEATRRAMFEVAAIPSASDTGGNALYLDPVLLGRTPVWGPAHFGADWKPYSDAELKTICQPLDFLGINCYWGAPVKAGANGAPELGPFNPERRTHLNWPVTPLALYWGVRFMHERYGQPILITENGMSNNDAVGADGKVHDIERIYFLKNYLSALRRAADEGMPLLGYLQWSLMDNFEWAEGYSQRFGLIHINYETQKRTLKDSALWYREVIASNGETL